MTAAVAGVDGAGAGAGSSDGGSASGGAAGSAAASAASAELQQAHSHAISELEEARRLLQGIYIRIPAVCAFLKYSCCSPARRPLKEAEAALERERVARHTAETEAAQRRGRIEELTQQVHPVTIRLPTLRVGVSSLWICV